jgi:hypothetical protein
LYWRYVEVLPVFSAGIRTAFINFHRLFKH